VSGLKDFGVGLPAVAVLGLTVSAACNGSARQVPSQKEAVIADGGKANLTPGMAIEFIGACDLKDSNPEPWDLQGKPLSAELQKWFWHAIDKDPKDKESLAVWQEDPESRTFAVAFRTTGQAFVSLPIEAHNRFHILSDISKPAKPKNGFPLETDGYIFKAPERPFDLMLKVEPRTGMDLLSFDANTTNLPKGVSFDFRTKTSTAFKATTEKKEDFVVRHFMVIAELHNGWEKLDLHLRIDGKSRQDKTELPIVFESATAQQGEDLDPTLKGKLIFVLSVQDKRNEDPKFVLSAKQSYSVQFKSIPVKATG
jgi:hypothetical protein